MAERFSHNFSKVRLHAPAALTPQAKLAVGAPDDQYEQEAERVAHEIAGMASLPAELSPGDDHAGRPQVQPSTCSPDPLPSNGLTPASLPEWAGLTVRRQAAEPNPQSQDNEEQIAQGEGEQIDYAGGSFGLNRKSESQLRSLRGQGQPLSDADRAFMEPRFGHSFEEVRVHTDSRAGQLARNLGARAFTVGQDIVFGESEYDPVSAAGRHLLAHELTHVIQQEGGTESTGARRAEGPAAGGYEAEAERVAGQVTAGAGPKAGAITPSRVAVQRRCVDGEWEFEYDGCSLPWIAAAVLGFGEGDDPAVGFHSPGNPTGERKDTRFAIPETRTGACDRHDACYQTCWPEENKEQYKQACDDQFRENMLDVCTPLEGGERRRCLRAANVYYQGVRIAGRGAFDKDQTKSCACEE